LNKVNASIDNLIKHIDQFQFDLMVGVAKQRC